MLLVGGPAPNTKKTPRGREVCAQSEPAARYVIMMVEQVRDIAAE